MILVTILLDMQYSLQYLASYYSTVCENVDNLPSLVLYTTLLAFLLPCVNKKKEFVLCQKDLVLQQSWREMGRAASMKE